MQEATLDSSGLHQRISAATLLATRLVGQRTAWHTRQKELVANVGAAKARLGLSEEVTRVFEALQNLSHERSVGSFERLLSAILQDVMPEEGSVRLLPEYKNNSTWLDIFLEKDNALEDILDGNGGAVTNVICTGLRFAALSRTANRRVMVLDEPDCWLQPARVPDFVRVISQVAAQSHTQTFLVSHHHPSYFEGVVNMVRIERDENGLVKAQVDGALVTEWQNDEEPGIRKIELVNFRSHRHTVIPCFPAATAFIGENNLGKSAALVGSFRALAYGESDETVIRHGEDEARVIFHLEKGMRLEWSRRRKGSPTVLYRLFRDGESTPALEGRPKTRNQAPEWVTEILGITRVDDLDIQVGSQKNPVFLLNDTASRRAQILSVGRESGHLRMLMKAYEGIRAADQETVRRGEAELAGVEYRLRLLGALDIPAEKLRQIQAEAQNTIAKVEKTAKLAAVLASLTAAATKVDGLKRELTAFASLPSSPPAWVDTTVLAGVLSRVETGVRRTNGLDLYDPAALEEGRLVWVGIPACEKMEEPQWRPTSALAAMLDRLEQIQRKMSAFSATQLALPELPTPKPTAPVEEVISKLSAQSAKVTAAQSELNTATKTKAQAEKDLAVLIDQLGGACPLCDAPLHHKEHAHA